MIKNRCLIFGLLAMLALNMLFGEASGKILFCKNCRTTRSASDPGASPNHTTVHTGNIINAPLKCKPGQVLDRKNVCRKLVFNN